MAISNLNDTLQLVRTKSGRPGRSASGTLNVFRHSVGLIRIVEIAQKSNKLLITFCVHD